MALSVPVKLSTYRPDIDGLRAVAVLAVIAYHLGLPLPGGFVGVDVFFVISGYLITAIVFHEVQEERFSLLGFYDRRVRRILPALLTVLVASLVAGYWLLWPGDYSDLAESAAYAAFGLGNLFFFFNTGYFDQASELQPLLHTWSLGVEEQFYVVWPLLLWATWRVFPHRRALIALVAIISAVSLAAAVSDVATDPKTAFYLPHTRAWELAIGGGLALLPTVTLSARMAGLAGAVGLALIATAMLLLTAETPFPGLAALPPCVGAALLILGGSKANVVTRVVGWAPFAFVGRLSYSLYLWHWPMLVLYRYYQNGEEPGLLEASGLALATAGLAVATYYLVERPFRLTRPRAIRNVSFGFAAMALSSLLGAGVVLSNGALFRVPETSNGLVSRDAMWEWPCETAPVDYLGYQCVFGAPWRTATSRALLWGDSQAEHFAPLLEEAAKRNNVAVVLFRACPPIIDEQAIHWHRPQSPDNAAYCRDRWERADRFLSASTDVDYVLLAAVWSKRTLDTYDSDPSASSPELGLSLLASGIRSAAARWSAPGRQFTILGDIPSWHGDPVPCAQTSAATILRASCPEDLRWITAAAFERDQGPAAHVLAGVDHSNADIEVVYSGAAMCREERCVSTIDGNFLYRDEDHFRRNLPSDVQAALVRLLGLDRLFDQPSSAASRPSKPAATKAQSSS